MPAQYTGTMLFKTPPLLIVRLSYIFCLYEELKSCYFCRHYKEHSGTNQPALLKVPHYCSVRYAVYCLLFVCDCDCCFVRCATINTSTCILLYCVSYTSDPKYKGGLDKKRYNSGLQNSFPEPFFLLVPPHCCAARRTGVFLNTHQQGAAHNSRPRPISPPQLWSSGRTPSQLLLSHVRCWECLSRDETQEFQRFGERRGDSPPSRQQQRRGTTTADFRHFPDQGISPHHPPPHRAFFFSLSPMRYSIVCQRYPRSTLPKWHVSAKNLQTALILPDFQTALILPIRGRYK